MDKTTKRITIAIILFIIIDVIILIYIINKEPDYNKELYDEIYSEYNEIFEEEKVEDTAQVIQEQENENENKKENIIYTEKSVFGDEYRVAGKIGIKKINLYSPIINETTDELMKIAPTKLCGPDLNEVGNLCIIGHNYRNDQFFSNLSTLGIGDEIVIIDNNKEGLAYEVYDQYEISETDLSCLSQETNGKKELTLITCTKNKKNRYVVKCREIE